MYFSFSVQQSFSICHLIIYCQTPCAACIFNHVPFWLSYYFPTLLLQYKIEQSQNILSVLKSFDIQVNVFGGGLTGQAEAVRLGIARALVKLNPENKISLRKEGLITRDPRMVERKKPGQRKARKKTQFSKR